MLARGGFKGSHPINMEMLEVPDNFVILNLLKVASLNIAISSRTTLIEHCYAAVLSFAFNVPSFGLWVCISAVIYDEAWKVIAGRG